MGEALAQQLVATCSDPAFVVDGRQRVIAWNPDADATLGLSDSAAQGVPCYRLLRGVCLDGSARCSPDCSVFSALRQGAPPPRSRALWHPPTASPMEVETSVLGLPLAGLGDPHALIFFRPLRALERGSRLRLHLLGGFQAVLKIGEVPRRLELRPQLACVLARLALGGGIPRARDLLLESLWPDEPPQDAWPRLRFLLHDLRRRLEPDLPPRAASRFLVREGEAYGLRRDCTWSDVWALDGHAARARRCLDEGDRDTAARELRSLIALYRGELLRGFDLAPDALAERERVRCVFLNAVVALGRLELERGDPEAASQAIERGMIEEPYEPRLHRLWMRAYALAVEAGSGTPPAIAPGLAERAGAPHALLRPLAGGPRRPV